VIFHLRPPRASGTAKDPKDDRFCASCRESPHAGGILRADPASRRFVGQLRDLHWYDYSPPPQCGQWRGARPRPSAIRSPRFNDIAPRWTASIKSTRPDRMSRRLKKIQRGGRCSAARFCLRCGSRCCKGVASADCPRPDQDRRRVAQTTTRRHPFIVPEHSPKS